MMPQPWSRSMLMMRNRCATSSSVRDEVGSSNTMTFALYDTALAISTIWRCETGSVLMTARGFTLTPSFSNSFWVSAYIFFSDVKGPTRGYRPSHMLSITLRFKAWFSS